MQQPASALGQHQQPAAPLPRLLSGGRPPSGAGGGGGGSPRPRPVWRLISPSSSPPSTNSKGQAPEDKAGSEAEERQKRCSHCGSQHSSGEWCRHKATGLHLCAACGQFSRNHDGSLPSREVLQQRRLFPRGTKEEIAQRRCRQCGSRSPGNGSKASWLRHPATKEGWYCESCCRKARRRLEQQQAAGSSGEGKAEDGEHGGAPALRLDPQQQQQRLSAPTALRHRSASGAGQTARRPAPAHGGSGVGSGGGGNRPAAQPKEQPLASVGGPAAAARKRDRGGQGSSQQQPRAPRQEAAAAMVHLAGGVKRRKAQHPQRLSVPPPLPATQQQEQQEQEQGQQHQAPPPPRPLPLVQQPPQPGPQQQEQQQQPSQPAPQQEQQQPPPLPPPPPAGQQAQLPPPPPPAEQLPADLLGLVQQAMGEAEAAAAGLSFELLAAFVPLADNMEARKVRAAARGATVAPSGCSCLYHGHLFRHCSLHPCHGSRQPSCTACCSAASGPRPQP